MPANSDGFESFEPAINEDGFEIIEPSINEDGFELAPTNEDGFEIVEPTPPGIWEGAWRSLERGVMGAQAILPNVILPEAARNLKREQQAAAIGLPVEPMRSTRRGVSVNPSFESRKLVNRSPEDRAAAVAKAQAIRDIWAGVASEMQQEIAAVPKSQAQAQLAAAISSADKWQVFKQYPGQVISSIVLESLPPSLAGATIGTAVGGPGVGTAVGAGMASGLQTFSSEFLNGAVQAGFDPRNEQQLAAFLESPAFEQAFGTALAKASIVGSVDAATAGAAGTFLRPALKQGLAKVVLASGKEAGMQAAGGAGGEFLAQAATKGNEPFDWFDISMEAAAEIATAGPEALGNVREVLGKPAPATSAAKPATSAAKPASNVQPEAAPVAVDDLKGLEAAMRGNQLKPKAESVSTKPKPEAADIVMADLPEAARAQLTRRMETGPETAESLPAPEKQAPGPAEYVPPEDVRAALEFQRKTDEAVKAAIENPDKEYDTMTRQELELLEALGDARATAALRRMATRRMETGPETAESLPAPEKQAPGPAEYVPPEDVRAAKEFEAKNQQELGTQNVQRIDRGDKVAGMSLENEAGKPAAGFESQPGQSATRIYRAGDADETGVKPFSSWSEEKSTAEAYLDNPGFGGDTLRTEFVDLIDVLDADIRTRRGLRRLAEQIGLDPDQGEAWMDNGWQYPWEESSKVKQALKDSGFKWLRYVDDFPEGAKTIIPLKEINEHRPASFRGNPTNEISPDNRERSHTVSMGRADRDLSSPRDAQRGSPEHSLEGVAAPDVIESALDKLKIELPPGSLQAFGLLPETWNQLIELVRKAYRAGKSIAAAIDEGIAWLREQDKDFDEPAVRAALERQTAPTTEPDTATQLEDIQQQLERIELNIIRTRRKGDAKRTRSLLDERARLQEAFNRLRAEAQGQAETVEGTAPAPIPEITQSQLDKVSSATLDGNPSAETFWTRLRKALRYFATSTPEIAVTGDEAQNAAMFRRGVRLFGVETQNARRTAAREINKVLEPIRALGRDVTNPDAVNQFFALGKKIRREEARANPNEDKLAKLRRLQTQAREKLESNPWYLFQQAVLWRDLWYRGKFLRTPSGGEITLPGGLELDQVERAMQRNQELIDANPNADAIRASLRGHYELMAQLQESLLQHGELIPDELRNPLYFPHHLLEKFTGQLDRARPTTEKDFRAYLIAPVGSEKLIEAGYINALYKHVNDVTVHNARADVVEKYWRPYDKAAERQAELEAEAEAEDRTVHPDAWKRNLPPGTELFTPSEEIPMRADYILNRGELAKALGVSLPANGDLRSVLEQIGADVRLTGDMIQKALVAGERPQWLLPVEIAEAIRGVVRREEAKSADTVGRRIGEKIGKFVQLWKWNTLFNPQNWFRYEYGNLATDVIDKMLGADPGMARYLGRALKEVRDAARGERTDEYELAEREGVLQTVTASEVSELMSTEEFKDFSSSEEMNGKWRLRQINRFLGMTTRASALRESTFRYAKFLADLERIRRGEQPVYAGAYWRDVQAAPTPEAKAAEITMKTFGDYSEMSVVGDYLRRYIIPFWSWQEINLKYHANLFRNLHDMLTLPAAERPRGARQAARAAALSTAHFTARAAVGIALRLAVMRLAVEMWNQFGGAWAGLWDDDEDLEGQLSAADRRRFHLILGKDDNGRVKVVYVPNALSDVAEWFGGNNFARLFTEWAKGDISFGQFASDFGKQLPTDLLNKVAQGVGPAGKALYIATAKQDPFPDVTAQRKISQQDLGWIILQTLTDRDAATFLRQQLDKDFYAPEDLGDWLGRKLLQIRRRDAEQWAYYEIRDKAADWKEERTGKRNEGFDYKSPDQQVIRNFRKAIYRGDMENAVRFYHRLRDYGYTEQRFAASIRNGDPLSDLTKLERREFEAGLTAYEREMLARAQRYYGRLAAGKGREGTLFPKDARSTRRASEEQIKRVLVPER